MADHFELVQALFAKAVKAHNDTGDKLERAYWVRLSRCICGAQITSERSPTCWIVAM